MRVQATISVATIPTHTPDTRMTGSTGIYFGLFDKATLSKMPFSLSYRSHGTRCAGEVSGARDNGICGVGVAYDSKVAGTKTSRTQSGAFYQKMGVMLQNIRHVSNTIHKLLKTNSSRKCHFLSTVLAPMARIDDGKLKC